MPATTSTETVRKDTLPAGWWIEEIAKAAHPSAVVDCTHILAWKRMEDNRPLLVEECLVLCLLHHANGPDTWYLTSMYRHPGIKQSDKWQMSMVHALTKEFPTGIWLFHSHGYNQRPSNKEIYDFMDEFRWRLGPDDGFKLLDGAVCRVSWEAIVKEKPTRLFPEQK